jgi:hypothetical protein
MIGLKTVWFCASHSRSKYFFEENSCNFFSGEVKAVVATPRSQEKWIWLFG